MTRVQTLNLRFIAILAVATSLLLVAMAPAVAGAQTSNSTSSEMRKSAPNLEEIREKIDAIRARVKILMPTMHSGDDDMSTTTDARMGRTLENGLLGLPDQVSDRAKQVMLCLQPRRVLRVGTQGDDVQQVQEFLKEKGFFKFHTATGYFGPVTRDAIQAFQLAKGIVSNGSPETTGFGQVGPRTQMALEQASCLNEGRASDSEDEEDDDVEEEDEPSDTDE